MHEKRSHREKYRPEQENLSLNRERPEMLEGRFIAYTLGEIIDRTVRQVPVLVVKQRGLGINGARVPLQRWQDS